MHILFMAVWLVKSLLIHYFVCRCVHMQQGERWTSIKATNSLYLFARFALFFPFTVVVFHSNNRMKRIYLMHLVNAQQWIRQLLKALRQFNEKKLHTKVNRKRFIRACVYVLLHNRWWLITSEAHIIWIHHRCVAVVLCRKTCSTLSARE